MFSQQLKQFVQDNPKLVSMKPAGDGIFVLKYKKVVFYNNLWNEFLEECRGTIVDANFNVVSRPFTKIYNYGIEDKAPVLSDDTLVTAYRKVNGFMVAVTWHNDDVLVSTTGSTDSDFVAHAKKMMLKHMNWNSWRYVMSITQGQTMMFECVHPNDPHIVVEEPGMYFLGFRENSWDSKIEGFGIDNVEVWETFAKTMLMCYFPESFIVTLGELKNMTQSCRHEGFVFYTKNGESAKIKSPYYLTSKWVARNPRTDRLVDLKNDIKKNLDEEYYPLIDEIRANIEEYTEMNEQERLAWVRNILAQDLEKEMRLV